MWKRTYFNKTGKILKTAAGKNKQVLRVIVPEISAAQVKKVDNLFRHPTQLYEALFEGLILFLIIIYFRNRGFIKFPGFISGLFLFFYSIFRFVIEFFRVPDEQLGYLFFNLTMGQIISFIFLLIGIYLLIAKYENKKES